MIEPEKVSTKPQDGATPVLRLALGIALTTTSLSLNEPDHPVGPVPRTEGIAITAVGPFY
jgi:hypothetical protein